MSPYKKIEDKRKHEKKYYDTHPARKLRALSYSKNYQDNHNTPEEKAKRHERYLKYYPSYYAKNHDRIRARQNKYAREQTEAKRIPKAPHVKRKKLTHEELLANQRLRYYLSERSVNLAKQKERVQNHRLMGLYHYSFGDMCCARCSKIDVRVLSFDHIQHCGSKRREIIGSHHLSEWLYHHNFPEGFQVLCMKCQFIKKAQNNETATKPNGTPEQMAMRKHLREKYKQKRLMVLQHYSEGTMECKTCGDTEYDGLSMDHIAGGGKKHAKEIGGCGTALTMWLIRNNYPGGFQVLCMNCQWIKRHENHEVKSLFN